MAEDPKKPPDNKDLKQNADAPSQGGQPQGTGAPPAGGAGDAKNSPKSPAKPADSAASPSPAPAPTFSFQPGQTAQPAANATNPVSGTPAAPPTASSSTFSFQPGQAAQPAQAAAGAAPAAGMPPGGASLNLEDGFISDKVQIILVTPFNETVGKLKEKFAADGNTKIYELPATAAPVLARQLIPCMIIGSISDNKDVIKHLSMLRGIAQDVRKNNIKVIMLSKIKNAAIIKSFEDYGCHEYILEPINERSLKFKLDLQTRAIAGQRKSKRKAEMAKADSGKQKPADAQKKTADLKDGEGGDDQLKKKGEDEKEGDEDQWVFKGNKVKKNGPKWTMRMKGPDPSQGEWQEVKKDDDGESHWRFMEKNEDPNAPKKDAVEWTGEKPEFKNGEWEFKGEKPNLAVVDENGNEKESKISSDKDGLNIGKESKLPSWKAKEKFQDEDREEELAQVSDEDFFGSKNKKNEKGKEDEKKDAKSGMGLGDFAAEQTPEKKPGGMEGLGFEEEKGEFNDKTGADKDANGKLKKNPTAIDLESEVASLGAKPPSKEKSELGDEEKDDVDLASMAMNFDEEPKDYDDKLKPDAKKNTLGKISLEDEDDALSGKPKGKDALGKDDKKTPSGELGELEDEELTGKPKKSGALKKGPGLGDGEDDDAQKSGQGKDSDDDELGRKPKSKKGAGKLGEDGESEEDDLDDLASMAMDFEEELEDYSDKVKPGSKNKAGINKQDLGTEEGGPTPQGKGKGGPTPQGKGKGKGKGSGGEDEIGPGKKPKKRDGTNKDGDEDSDELDLSSMDMGFEDKGATEDTDDFHSGDPEATGSSAFTDGGPEGSGRKINARDSDQEEEGPDGPDKLIEIDAVNGSLKSKKIEQDEKFEYPVATFGSDLGTWESAGSGGKSADGRKLYVFVESVIRTDPKFDIKAVPVWWIVRTEVKPAYVSKTKIWIFTAYRPERIEGFGALPTPVREYLISISPKAREEKRAEDVAKAKAEAEEKKNAKDEERAEAKKKAAEDDSIQKDKRKSEADDEDEFLGKKKKSDDDSSSKSISDEALEEAGGKSGKEDGSDSEDEFDKIDKKGESDKEGSDSESGDSDSDSPEEISLKKKKLNGADSSAEADKDSEEVNDKVGKSSNDDTDELAAENKPKGSSKSDEDKEPSSNSDDKAKAGESGDSDDADGGNSRKPTAEDESSFSGENEKPHLSKKDDGQEGAGEENEDTKSKVLRLPSSPMVAVVLSELLLFSQNDIEGALQQHCKFLSEAMGGSQVVFFAALENLTGLVVASTDNEKYPKGKTETFANIPAAKACFEARSTQESKESEEQVSFYCPVLPRASESGGAPLGMMLVVAKKDAALLSSKVAYLQGVAQVLRGPLVHFNKSKQTTAKKAA